MKTKTFLAAVGMLIINCQISIINCTAQSPNWLWAKSAGGTITDVGVGITTDAGGNVYAAGYFISSSIAFGTTTLANVQAGNSDIFLVKYDASGNVLWAKSAGSTGYDSGNGISTDSGGNVYVTGYFDGTSSITFGTTT